MNPQQRSILKQSETLNRNNPAMEKNKDLPAKANKKEKSPSELVRNYMITNRQSLKTAVAVSRVLLAFDKSLVAPEYMKSEVNRLLNKKFFI